MSTRTRRDIDRNFDDFRRRLREDLDRRREDRRDREDRRRSRSDYEDRRGYEDRRRSRSDYEDRRGYEDRKDLRRSKVGFPEKKSVRGFGLVMEDVDDEVHKMKERDTSSVERDDEHDFDGLFDHKLREQNLKRREDMDLIKKSSFKGRPQGFYGFPGIGNTTINFENAKPYLITLVIILVVGLLAYGLWNFFSKEDDVPTEEEVSSKNKITVGKPRETFCSPCENKENIKKLAFTLH